MSRHSRLMRRLTAVTANAGHALSIGGVSSVTGLAVHVGDLDLPTGAMCEIEMGQGTRPLLCEVVGLGRHANELILAAYGPTEGISPRAAVRAVAPRATAPTGKVLLGRVIDGLGRPLDVKRKGPLTVRRRRPLRPSVAHPLERAPVSEVLATGVRAIDAFATIGRGQRVGVSAPAGVGKALALDTPIPTPRGWTTMAAVHVGDEVFDQSGQPCRVLATSEVMRDRECFVITFSDGSRIVADADHQWRTTTYKERTAAHEVAKWLNRHRPGLDLPIHSWAERVRTTREIASDFRTPDGRANHAVAVAGPLQYPERELPIDPYVLGAWLGDGTSSNGDITCAEGEILDRIRAAGYRVVPRKSGGGIRYGIQQERRWSRDCLQAQLRRLGVLGNKHIPRLYMEASPSQRLELLRGLMDTDGTAGKNGGTSYDSMSRRLALDVQELVISLGIKAHLEEDVATLYGRRIGPAWRVHFTTTQRVFHVRRKAERQIGGHSPMQRLRYITDVSPHPSVPVRCIQVDSESRMFLAGRTCIPTHNSTLLGMIARGNSADVNVIALIGERGKEVKDFIDNVLGPEGLAKSVVVVATSDEPALFRVRAAQMAASIAEDFRDKGLHVAFFSDSVTRFANAQRDLGRAAGEAPGPKGYPPSVFFALPELLERAGMGEEGSITAFHTVLVQEVAEDEDVIAQEVRARLDGHIVLSRELSEAAHYPPVDVVASLSRVMPAVVSREHYWHYLTLRMLLAAYRDGRRMIQLDAYKPGSDALLDAAVAMLPQLNALLQQPQAEKTPFEVTVAEVARLGREVRERFPGLPLPPLPLEPLSGDAGDAADGDRA